jgi:hypothetical protein
MSRWFCNSGKLFVHAFEDVAVDSERAVIVENKVGEGEIAKPRNFKSDHGWSFESGVPGRSRSLSLRAYSAIRGCIPEPRYGIVDDLVCNGCFRLALNSMNAAVFGQRTMINRGDEEFLGIR